MSRLNGLTGAGAALVLAAALAACGGGSGDGSTATASPGDATEGTTDAAEAPVEMTQLKVMMFPSQVYRLPAVVAQETGIFEKHGLEVEFVDQPTGIQGVQAMFATESQVGQHSLSTLAQGFQAGESLTFFCGAVDVIQTSLVAPPGSGLPSANEGADWQEVLQALEGKTVGIQTPIGSGVQLLFAGALAEAGVTDVNYVNIGTDMATVRASLGNGSVDVAQVTPPVLQTLVGDNVAEQLIYLPDGPTVYRDGFGSGWSTPTDWLADNEPAAQAYCTAMTEALEIIHDESSTDQVAGLLAADMGIPVELATQVLEDGTYDDHQSELNLDRIQSTLDLYFDLEILPADPPVTAADVAQRVNE